MKKVFTVIFSVFLFASISVQAQTEKGSVYIGGSAVIETTSTRQQQNNSFASVNSQFEISPSIAWAYKNNRFFGFSLSWEYQQSTDSSIGASGHYGYSIPSFGGSVFLRQYKPLGKGFYIYAQEALGLSFEYGHLYGYKLSGIKTEFLFSPGIAYNVSKHLQLELQMSNIAEIGYLHNKQSGNGTIYAPYANGGNFLFLSSVEGGLLNNLTFGVRYFL